MACKRPLSSLWVIGISSHLIALTRDTALRPMITEARKILEEDVYAVRGMHHVALASLYLHVLTTVWLYLHGPNALICTAMLLALLWQFILKHAVISRRFLDRCGEDWVQNMEMGSFWKEFLVVWQHSSLLQPPWRKRNRVMLSDESPQGAL